jgi:glyoxylase-like metal-dependent hydrolase (beta-lactamase superfamily II)
MGYDVEPLVTLETKRRVLARAADEDWLVVFEHDTVVPWGRVRHDGRAYALAPDPTPRRARWVDRRTRSAYPSESQCAKWDGGGAVPTLRPRASPAEACRRGFHVLVL